MRQKNCEVTKENKQVPLYKRYQEGYNIKVVVFGEKEIERCNTASGIRRATISEE